MNFDVLHFKKIRFSSNILEHSNVDIFPHITEVMKNLFDAAPGTTKI